MISRPEQLMYNRLPFTWTDKVVADFISPVCSRCANYRRLAFDRTHVAVINYDWRLPGLKDANWFLKGVINGWQITGITQFISGQPEDIGAGISGINLGQRLGGTWTEAVSGYFNGEPNASKEREKYFNWETTRLPSIAEALAAKGAYPRNYLSRPGINVTDLSVFKNFPLGGDTDVGITAGTFGYGDEPDGFPEVFEMVAGNGSMYALGISDTLAEEYGGGLGIWLSD